jgi:positive regulator of sigma E activity
MYAQIVIECQTQNNPISCDYCIAKEACQLHLEEKDNNQKGEHNFLILPSQETLTNQQL